MAHNAQRWALFAISALVITFGVAEIALEEYVKRRYKTNVGSENYVQTYYGWPPLIYGEHTPDPYLRLKYLPANLDTSVTTVIFVAGALALAAGGSGVMYIFAVATEQQERNIRRLSVLTRCSSSIATVFAAVTLIFAFVKEYTSSHFHYTGPASPFQHFTQESWICQINTYFAWRDFGFICDNAKAARWLLIPFLMVLIVFTALNLAHLRQLPQSQSKADVLELEPGQDGESLQDAE